MSGLTSNGSPRASEIASARSTSKALRPSSARESSGIRGRGAAKRRLRAKIGVHLLASEESLVGIPREEDGHAELDRLAGRGVLQPIRLVSGRHVGFLADALRADDDVDEVEVDVGESAEQACVEARRALVSLPAVVAAGDLVDAVVRERGEEAGDVALFLGLRMALPELADLVVLVGVDWAAEQLPNVVHGRVGSSRWPRGSPRTRSLAPGSPPASGPSRCGSRPCAATG